LAIAWAGSRQLERGQDIPTTERETQSSLVAATQDLCETKSEGLGLVLRRTWK